MTLGLQNSVRFASHINKLKYPKQCNLGNLLAHSHHAQNQALHIPNCLNFERILDNSDNLNNRDYLLLYFRQFCNTCNVSLFEKSINYFCFTWLHAVALLQGKRQAPLPLSLVEPWSKKISKIWADRQIQVAFWWWMRKKIMFGRDKNQPEASVAHAAPSSVDVSCSKQAHLTIIVFLISINNIKAASPHSQ